MAPCIFPEDVLREILARLPVKSLLRFQLVTKSWRDILKEPTFITKHHLTQAALDYRNCILTRAVMLDSKKFCLLTEDEQEIKCTALEAAFLGDTVYLNLQVAGPCNGLVIISNGYDDLFLWNPATRESKAFPSTSQPSLSDNHDRQCTGIGFGINPITKDYTVVRIWSYYLSENDFIDKAEVFYLSANPIRPKGKSWKIIDPVPPISLCYDHGQAYLNGKYYWCTEWLQGREVRRFHIMWFDMGAEVFGLIELPNLCNDFYWNGLGLFEDSLAVVGHAFKEENGGMREIWIMDGSNGHSWTKYATVGPFKEYEEPLGFWKNDKLVVLNCRPLEYTSESYSYDIKTHVTKKIMQDVFLNTDSLHPVYNESLVSITGEEWCEDKEILDNPFLVYLQMDDYYNRSEEF